MTEMILNLAYGAVVMLFGFALTAAYAGIRGTWKNTFVFFGLYAICGALQIVATAEFSEALVWKLYPLITHLPLTLLLCLHYRKSLPTALAAVFTAYLCCQPSKWVGILVLQLTKSFVWSEIARMLALLVVGYLCLFRVASCLEEIFNKDRRSVCIFGLLPAVYYVFDYATAVYSDLWGARNPVVTEFVPLVLTCAYVVFCFIYYREHEQKADALRNEQIMRVTARQQEKELQAIKTGEQELRLLRHDMRLILSSIDQCMENGDTEKAREMIAAYTESINRTHLERFCENDALNYVLSDYFGRCKAAGVPFSCLVELEELAVEEIPFCTIVSNALDNALNAQKLLPAEKRGIRVMIKTAEGKLLLSVKNPVGKKVRFVDGLPVAGKPGHGFGTQSIRYMTEKLGGNCQFSVTEGTFVLRVVL